MKRPVFSRIARRIALSAVVFVSRAGRGRLVVGLLAVAVAAACGQNPGGTSGPGY